MQRFRHFLATALLIFISTSAYAGAWLEERHQTLAMTQFTYFSSSEFFDSGGHTQKQPTFDKYEAQPYVEYGLTSNITIGGTVYLDRATQSGFINNSLADPTLFVRGRLYEDEVNVLSIQPLVKLPSRYENSALPRAGSSSWDGEVSLLYGRGLHLISTRDYLDTSIGYRLRDEDLAAQYHADVALGLRWGNLLFTPAIRSIYTPSVTSTFSENGDQSYDLVKAELGVAYMFDDDQWVQATGFDHLYGRSTGTGLGFSIAYAKRF